MENQSPVKQDVLDQLYRQLSTSELSAAEIERIEKKIKILGG